MTTQGEQTTAQSGLEPAGEGSLVCVECGHPLGRVVVCGTQDRCTAGKFDLHYHCLYKECGEKCSSLGECKPKGGRK